MVAQAKMAIDTKNGTIDHPSSSQMEPVIGAPTFSPVWSRYFTAKTMTKNTTISAKNAVTAVTKKYRLSTAGARVDACSGKSGIPSNIFVTVSRAARRRHSRLAASHDQNESADPQHRHDAAKPDEVHHHESVAAALGVVVEAVEQQFVDRRADAPLAGFHQGKAQFLRRVLDAVEVAGQP